MVDVMSVEKRSALMSRIRAKNTHPEMQVRKFLWRQGFRYRLHSPSLPGRPDLVLPRWQAVVFVHGCYWHYHEGCPLFRLPATRADFWLAKLSANRERDERSLRGLRSDGWRVAVVWECALRVDAEDTGHRLASWLRGNSVEIEIEAGSLPARRLKP